MLEFYFTDDIGASLSLSFAHEAILGTEGFCGVDDSGRHHRVGEDALAAAKREFFEKSIRQNRQKELAVWALEGDCEPRLLVSNRLEMEWPSKSKKRQSFPEADRGGWFSLTP